ncbi:MAG: hypothetical protein SFV53_06390 [Rickettsiales bacterium]|nr:hypothetical protein [Rickettsiales bacterium]
MNQLNLDLPKAKNFDPYSAKDFLILEENRAAFNFLEKFFTQDSFSQAQFTSLILKGARHSGKTHLLSFFTKKYQAEFLQIEKISQKNLVKIFTTNQFYILEDIDKIENEEMLLHIINSAFEAKAFLILSLIKQHKFNLKDLSSRLKNIFALQIKDPKSETIEILLINALSRRQIKVSNHIIDFITNHIAHDYSEIFFIVDAIESYLQVERKNLTTKKITEILAEIRGNK